MQHLFRDNDSGEATITAHVLMIALVVMGMGLFRLFLFQKIALLMANSGICIEHTAFIDATQNAGYEKCLGLTVDKTIENSDEYRRFKGNKGGN